MVYYSKNLNGFIPELFKEDGTYTDDTWPSDAVLLTEDEISKYFKVTPPVGKKLGEKKGRPVWEDLPQKEIDYEAEARTLRNNFISFTDVMVVVDYSIKDEGLTASQINDLMETRKLYKSWPKQKDWPLIELPKVPKWLLDHTIANGYKEPLWPPKI